MALGADRYPPYDPPHDQAHYPAPPPPHAPAYDAAAARREPLREHELTREVTSGPFRFGLRDGILGILGLFAILGVILGVLGFAAAFALDEAREAVGTNDAEAAAVALPAFLVSVLPFLAAPVLALGLGAWAGHASRNAGIGASAGAIGGLLGPILALLLMGVGFALGAGAANLDLSSVNAPAFGVAPGWGSTMPYLFTGAGLLWLLANTLAGGLAGGLVGGILEHRWARETHAREKRYARRSTRY